MKWLNYSKYSLGYKVEVILDSLIPCNRDGGKLVRVTTLEVTLPRIVLAEQNTHRVMSRNTSSSRAIPTSRIRKDFCTFEPHKFPINCKGMQPKKYIKKRSMRDIFARVIWRLAKYSMFLYSFLLEKLGIHKQIVNRLLEPFMWTTMIITSTKWNNYFTLRVHKDAQLEIRIPAYLIKRALRDSVPIVRHFHLPFLNEEDYIFTSMLDRIVDKGKKVTKKQAEYLMSLIKISVARIARGSYLNQRKKSTVEDDFNLYQKLIESKPIHASPSESVVFSHRAFEELKRHIPMFNVEFPLGFGGNLGDSVVQYRKIIEDRSVQN